MGFVELWQRLQTLSPTIQTRQTTYKSLRGRYFQGLITHSVLPEDETEAAPDRLDAKPAGQLESWNDVFTNFPATLPFAIEIHTYNDRKGNEGYIIVITLHINNRRWKRRHAFGGNPEQFITGWEPLNNKGAD